MRTSFHHQPEAQHPNLQLSTSCRPITPSIGATADIDRQWGLKPRSLLIAYKLNAPAAARPKEAAITG